ncbi:MAG: AAA family ATPase [Gammaproteobacteria bacterium]|jgi:type II secretory pathway predicted ATPase ExeA
MHYALRQGEGFIMVTGLPGTGKTTLTEQFRAELNGASRALVATLTSTRLQADELLRLICLSVGAGIELHDKASMLHQFHEFLSEQAEKGRRTLVLVDEAQDLPIQALEELRLLSNLQHKGRPLLQIFLVGQQQLLDVVQRPAMQPLYQRLIAACQLEPLSLDETRAYIHYRLNRAGWNGDAAFDERSYRMIHRFADGFPRQINKTCSRLLLYGSTEKKRRLDCFDCLEVLKHLFEELPNSCIESSYQACVEMLNTSGGVRPSSGDAGQLTADASSPVAGREPPSSADLKATPEPQSGQSDSDERQGVASIEQIVAPPPVAGGPDGATANSFTEPAKAMPAEQTALGAGSDFEAVAAPGIAAVEPVRDRRAGRRLLRHRTTPEVLQMRTESK